jgi:hypothetical protein
MPSRPSWRRSKGDVEFLRSSPTLKCSIKHLRASIAYNGNVQPLSLELRLLIERLI